MTSNKIERFQQLARCFEQVNGLEELERKIAIEVWSEDNPDLAQELRGMLAVDVQEDANSDLAGSLVAAEAHAMETAIDVAQPELIGMQIADWKILRLLGEGGMGAVYLAERADGALKAKAAIKFVRGGLPSSRWVHHFFVERQTLASLSHVGIAKLLDGGTTEEGTPYLVMEYVDGETITEYCTRRCLSLQSRLRLFLKVCDAVAYAHRHLVAHLDLKPSNIIVDADGSPRLLDFGISRLLSDLEEGSLKWTTSFVMTTPAYASPEQIRGERPGTATDIYALGVILYELLTGRLPLGSSAVSSVAFGQMIKETVPPLASARTSNHKDQRMLRGDLDTLLSKSLRKRPNERYASVDHLAAEIRNYLNHWPLSIRNDDWKYRAGQFVRRNGAVLSLSSAAFFMLIAFTVSTVLQTQSLSEQRNRAQEEGASAQRVSQFLEDLLSGANPDDSADQNLSARELLDRGARRVFNDLESEPESKATLATVMARVYRKLGEYPAALPLVRAAVEIREDIGDEREEDRKRLAESVHEQGALAYHLGEYERALALQRKSLRYFKQSASGTESEIANVTEWIASTLVELGRFDEATETSRRALALYRELYRSPHATIASSMINLGQVLRKREKFSEALDLNFAALEQLRALHGDIHLDVAHALDHVSSTLQTSGRVSEALPYAREGLEIRRSIFRGAHPETAASLGNLAGIFQRLGRFEESERTRRESLMMLEEVFPDGHPYVADTMSSLGDLLRESGKVFEAESVLREALDQHRRFFPADHMNLADPLTALGQVLLASDRADEAEPLLQEAVDLGRANLAPNQGPLAVSMVALGQALSILGQHEEASVLIQMGYQSLFAVFGPDDARVIAAHEQLDRHESRLAESTKMSELAITSLR